MRGRICCPRVWGTGAARNRVQARNSIGLILSSCIGNLRPEDECSSGRKGRRVVSIRFAGMKIVKCPASCEVAGVAEIKLNRVILHSTNGPVACNRSQGIFHVD